MTDNRETIEQFIARNNIGFSLTRANNNPNMDSEQRMFHYRATLSHDGAEMTVPFSTGTGWTTEPTAADVLSCLASDSASVADSSFEDWAADMGYDEDSRKAERIFRACEDQAEELRALLGEEEYENLLYNTEEA